MSDYGCPKCNVQLWKVKEKKDQYWCPGCGKAFIIKEVMKCQKENG
jgi:predicted RNA-binding Zn-ribbon protein involved in translation (DUF1610 family)